jgi:hypothetical protein
VNDSNPPGDIFPQIRYDGRVALSIRSIGVPLAWPVLDRRSHRDICGGSIQRAFWQQVTDVSRRSTSRELQNASARGYFPPHCRNSQPALSLQPRAEGNRGVRSDGVARTSVIICPPAAGALGRRALFQSGCTMIHRAEALSHVGSPSFGAQMPLNWSAGGVLTPAPNHQPKQQLRLNLSVVWKNFAQVETFVTSLDPGSYASRWRPPANRRVDCGQVLGSAWFRLRWAVFHRWLFLPLVTARPRWVSFLALPARAQHTTVQTPSLTVLTVLTVLTPSPRVGPQILPQTIY